ncbi:MAG TPA: tetratricopeptide repeat protein [Terriglobales bacterium]|nr:tetratricopeptide repeat protein [Terriglobales bacterium]
MRLELEKILASPLFRDAEGLKRFLRYTVEQTLLGQGKQLKEYRLGLEVFDRDASFDPRMDPVVRMAARRLRSKLKEYYAGEGKADPVQIEVPKGGYAVVYSPHPLRPPALEESEQVDPVPRLSRGMAPRKFAAMALFAGVSALALAIVWWNAGSRRRVTSASQVSSVAVLPFLNLTGDPNDEYLSDGITDDLTGGLAKLEGLRVVARTSAFKFKGKADDVRAIGKQLGVISVLEGSIQRSGSRLRVTTQLIRTGDGYHIWAETYDRDAHDAFAVEDEVTRSVGSALRIEMSHIEQTPAKRHLVDPEARDLYLRGRFWWNRRTPPTTWKSIEYFNQALEKDPLFAQAYLGLADAYFVLGTNDQALPADVFPKARAAARQALQIEDELGEAHATLAAVTYFYDWKREEAEWEFRRAIALNPNHASAHQWYGLLLMTSRRFSEATTEFQRAQDLDPLSLIISLDLGQVDYYSSNSDEAMAQARKALTYDPNFSAAHDLLGMAYLQKGFPKMALPEFEKYAALSGHDPDALMRLGQTYAAIGDRHRALEIIRAMENPTKGSYSSAYEIAVIYAALGEHGQTLELLRHSLDQHSSSCLLIGVDPAFAELQSDSHFQALLNRVGLP